jgi:hypothetical protein
MTMSSRSVARAAVLGFLGAGSIVHAATLATANESTVTFKPLAGISFDVGSKRMVGYFESDAGECVLTLMVTGAMIGDDVPKYGPVRLLQNIAAGETTTVDTPEGKSLQVICKPSASAMTARVLDVVAIYKPAK